MSYIEENLMNGEYTFYRTKLSFIIFLYPLLLLLFAMIAFNNNWAGLGSSLILITIIMSISCYITYKTSEFGITNKRIIAKTGFLSRTSTEVLLSKVEGIQVYQDLGGRFWDYGNITIIGTGGTKDLFKNICKPFEFRKRAQEQISIVQDLK